MHSFVNFTSKIDLQSIMVIIPSVSVGNVGQLTVDSLISSMGLKKVATIWDPALIPTVGNESFDGKSTQLCTACELFASDSHKLAVIQIRSAIEHKLALRFLTRLAQLLIDLKVKECVILTSAFEQEMHDVLSGRFRFVTNDEDRKMKLKEAKILDIEEQYGSGFAIKLYEIVQKHMSCCVIMKYASEGDNRPDAVQTFHLLNQIWGFESSFKFPESWRHVFGNPPPTGIY